MKIKFILILVIILSFPLVHGAEYGVVLTTKQNSLNPGDELFIPVYFSGGGNISKAKILFYGDEVFGIKEYNSFCNPLDFKSQQSKDVEFPNTVAYVSENPMANLFNSYNPERIDMCGIISSTDTGRASKADASASCSPFNFWIKVK